jgi:glycolate oxidase FAD binding subunit
VGDLTPAVVARPGSEAEVAAVLRAATAAGAVVVPFGAGTRQGIGHLPERADVVLSLAWLNQMVDYVPADMTVTAQAGMRLADLQARVSAAGQTVPLDPAGACAATLGGLVAAAAAGPRRLAYGGVRDLLLGARVVLADGRVVKTGGRVVKNVAGYDMNKLLCGSLGTLGVITAVTLKLRPLPAAAQTELFGFGDVSKALSAAEAVLNSELLPAAVVVLGAGPARRLEAPGPVTLAVALEETPANVAYMAERVAALTGGPAGPGRATLTGEAEARFWDALTNYGDRSGATWTLRVSALLSEAGRFLDSDAIAYAAGTATVMRYGFTEEAEAIHRLQSAAAGVGGSAVLEAAPPALRRQADPWGPPRPEWAPMRLIKERFDPSRILNRGRFVGGI